jgi:3-methyladenine DNA glycosylase Tag
VWAFSKDSLGRLGIIASVGRLANMSNEHRAPWECVYAKEDRSKCRPGKGSKSDQEYFEILCLCLLQAGLNWGSIRKHWPRYREGFEKLEIHRLSKAQASVLLQDSQVIKNRKKVEAIIHNAQVFQRLKKVHGSFSGFLRSLKQLTDEEAIRMLLKQFKHVRAYTAEYYLHSVGYWE